MVLTFTSGQTVGARHCAEIFAIDDHFIEDIETFSISLTALSSLDESIVRFTAERNAATVSIVQDPNDSVYKI